MTPSDERPYERPAAGPAATVTMVLLALSCFASQVSTRAVDPILPVIAGRFGVTVHHTAWLDSVYGLSYAMSQPILGPLADAIGKTRLVALCLAVLALSFVACASATRFDGLIAARVIGGAAAGGIFPVAIALVGDHVAIEMRQVAISRLVVAAVTGQMLGAALSGLITAVAGWRAVFALAALLAVGAAVASVRRPDFAHATRRPFSMSTTIQNYLFLFRHRRGLIIYGTVLCEGLFMFGVFPFVAPTLRARGHGGTVVAGLCVASFALGAVAYGVCARRVIARLGQWRMMMLGGSLAGICYAAIGGPLPSVGVAVLFACAGFGFYLLHNTLQTAGTELAPDARATAVALLAMFFFLGQGLSPDFAGWIATQGGFATMFVTCGLLMTALGIVSSVCLSRLSGVKSPPV